METNQKLHFDWASALKLGLLGGGIALYLCLVGLVETFGERDIVSGVISFGHTMLIMTFLGVAYIAPRRVVPREHKGTPIPQILVGAALSGLLAGGVVALLVIVGDTINLRAVLINASPELFDLLKFGQETVQGVILLLVGGAVVGALGGVLYLLPSWVRNSLGVGFAAVILVGLLRDILRVVLVGQDFLEPVADFLFASEGLTKPGAVFLFVVSFGIMALWSLRGQETRERVERMPPEQQAILRWTGIAGGILILMTLPYLLRSYLSNVIDTVGRFVLMGLGLNIVVGYAGLLDLGYVAFYAIGAYTMGVLTTTGNLGGAEMSFWVAMPISIGVTVLAGIILGVPVLNMRGDYLAIVTLGFGEIIRVLALSNWLRPYIGGAQGIIPIPKPNIALDVGPIDFSYAFDDFQKLYYLILIACAVAFFISWRLRDSRLGRAWMAMREDEDVAEAMGINLVKTKLLAFATGAAFAGASGAIFASQVSSIFPHSFNLIVSIQVLSLIIVGGMGSLPGVVVGSLFLIGLPEMLSELEEYKFLFYGAALVVMMLVRPEGLWPEATRRRELHDVEVEEELSREAAAS